jgi:FKBP-type peptidyl-prolyl cis-trans isomerase FkpA
MKRRTAAFAVVAAFSAVLGLSACGGGSDDSAPSQKVYDAPALVKTDSVVGTGAEVTVGKTVTATYTLWLYDSTKADFKGTHIQGPATAPFMLSSSSVIEGWVQGLPGMRVGGKRTLIVPSSLGYKASGRDQIPGNSGLVFDITVTAVQ